MKKIIKPIFDFISKYYILIILFGLYILLTYIFKIPNCIVKLICGFPCPGCGLTRAGFAFLKFDFALAFQFNPLIFLLPFVFIVIIYKEYSLFNKIYRAKLFWVSLVILAIGIYIYRMIVVYPDVPMNYNPTNLIEFILQIVK